MCAKRLINYMHLLPLYLQCIYIGIKKTKLTKHEFYVSDVDATQP